MARQAAASFDDEGPEARVHQADRGRARRARASSSRRPVRDGLLGLSAAHSQVADDICMVRSMHTDAFNHHPGQMLLLPDQGSSAVRRWAPGPCTDSAASRRTCPAFTVLASGVGTSGGASKFSSGFLPSAVSGTLLRSTGDPILYLSNPEGVSRRTAAAASGCLRDLNQERLAETGDTEIASRIASYELAFRMQTAGPELMDFSRNPHALWTCTASTTRPRSIRHELPARPPDGRAWRAFRDADPWSWDQHANLNKALKKNYDIRSIDLPRRWIDRGPEARGLLDSNPGRLGRRGFGRAQWLKSATRPIRKTGAEIVVPNTYAMWMAPRSIKSGLTIRPDGRPGLQDRRRYLCHVHDLQSHHALPLSSRDGPHSPNLTSTWAGIPAHRRSGTVVKKILA